MGVKLENIKSQEFTINYTTVDGHIKSYKFPASKGNRNTVIEVPDAVYEHLRYETKTFELGYLALARDEENEAIIEDYINITEETPIIERDKIIELLQGRIGDLKKVLNSDSQLELVQEFVRVAKEIKLDSDSIKTYLATLLGHKDNKDFIFPTEE